MAHPHQHEPALFGDFVHLQVQQILQQAEPAHGMRALLQTLNSGAFAHILRIEAPSKTTSHYERATLQSIGYHTPQGAHVWIHADRTQSTPLPDQHPEIPLATALFRYATATGATVFVHSHQFTPSVALMTV